MSKFINRKELEKELDTKLQFHYKSKNISFFNYGYKNNNINLNPTYQRGQVWCNDGKVFLINSLLSGISIPPIILNQKDINTEEYDVIDGKQRLTTILDFINNKFPLNINDKIIYFDKIPQHLNNNDNICIFDENYREYFKQIEVQVTFYIELDEIKQREIFERINYGSPLKYGEKLKGSNSKSLYIIEKLINEFSDNFEEIGIKDERNNYYLKFGTIICLTNRDYKSASSGSPILKYFNNWVYDEKENETILNNSRINISNLVKLYSEINKYNSERSPKKLSKHLWNWSELLFNIYCINEKMDIKNLIKFNKFLYHWKFTKNFKKIENQDLEYFQKNWEELGRKNTNKESIYTKRIELYNLILGNINKTIPKNIKDKLRLNYFRTTNKLNCTTCINNDKNIINKNNFHCGHIISRNNGGIIHEVNLRPICGFCNSSMGSLDMDVYCQKNEVKGFYW